MTMYDLERTEKLPLLRKNAIKKYVPKLSEKPIFAIVFGSTAKGTYKDESDVDILLVTNKKIKTEEAEKEIEAQTSIKISSFQITFKEFLKDKELLNDKIENFIREKVIMKQKIDKKNHKNIN